MKTRHESAQGGFVVVTVISLQVTLMVLLAAYFFTTNVEVSSVKAHTDSVTGFYSAEAGLNIRGERIRQIFIGYNRPQGQSPAKENHCHGENMGSGDFACINFQHNNRTVVTYVEEDPNNNAEDDASRMIVIPQGELFEGLNAIQYRYTTYSEAVPGHHDRPEAILEMVFRSRLVPLFQFAAFYDKDLEILPGANMTLNGRVHANGDLYVNSGATLTIDGHITVSHKEGEGGQEGGRLIRNRKDRYEFRANSVRVNDGVSSPAPPIPGEGLIAQSVLDGWNGRIETGLDTLTVPDMQSFQPQTGGLYWDRADLVVALDLRDSEAVPKIIVPNRQSESFLPDVNMTAALNTGVCIDPDQCDASASYDPAPRAGLSLSYSALTDLDGSHQVYRYPVEASGSFYDNREGRHITMLEVDVQFLLARMHESSEIGNGMTSLFSQGPNDLAGIDDTTDGGLVLYFTVLGDDKGKYGVRIRNGEQLQACPVLEAGAPDIQGVTMVSDLPVYVHGHFNRDADPDDWRPAAIIADTLNILSDGWGKDKDGAEWDDRDASTTYVNAAFLAGTDTTVSGGYNGGLENYPRLHENWSGRTLHYKGSFVSLNEPQYASGDWSYGNPIYEAPQRAWQYDTRFNNAANLPPLTPRFVYLKQERFVRHFDR